MIVQWSSFCIAPHTVYRTIEKFLKYFLNKFNIATCNQPLLPTNGRSVHISGGHINGMYSEGSEAYFQCDPNYIILGYPSVCEANGNWTNYSCSGNFKNFRKWNEILYNSRKLFSVSVNLRF